MFNPFAAQGGPQQYWKQSSLTFKFFSLGSLAILLISLIIPSLMLFFFNIPVYTIFKFQIWRLFLSMFAGMPSLMSLIGLLFSFLWIYRYLKEDDCSTIYKFFEILIINLEINLVFCLILIPISFLTETSLYLAFFSFGWFNIILVYEFRFSAIDPEAQRQFCCLPFSVKGKYYPWVIFVLVTLFSQQFFALVAAAIIGHFQEVVRRQMFIKLPYSFYSKIESCLPQSVINRGDFVTVGQVQAKLKLLCYGGAGRSNVEFNEQPRQNNRFQNPFHTNSQENNSGIVGNSHGVQIGGSNETNFRNFWQQRQEDNYQPRQNNKQDINNNVQDNLIYGQVIQNKNLTNFPDKSTQNSQYPFEVSNERKAEQKQKSEDEITRGNLL